jgi:preprotein translocase subunit Sec61beta
MQRTKNEEQAFDLFEYEEQFQMDFTPQDVVLTAILVSVLFLSAFGILFGSVYVVSSIVQLIR